MQTEKTQTALAMATNSVNGTFSTGHSGRRGGAVRPPNALQCRHLARVMPQTMGQQTESLITSSSALQKG